MVSLLNNDIIETKTDRIGFVFPAYVGMPPAPVLKFLKKLDLSSSNYIFCIATRAGSPIWAIRSVTRNLKKQGKSLDASFILTMPGNCEGVYKGTVFPTDEIITNLESLVQNTD